MILAHWQWGDFEKKTFTIQNYRKMALPVSPEGIMQYHWNMTTHLSLKYNCQVSFP